MNPEDVLKNIQKHAEKSLTVSLLDDTVTSENIDYVCRCTSNRSGVRLIMACLLAKLDKPHVDPRKPYTEIGSDDSFSGRSYDEHYLTAFINAYQGLVLSEPDSSVSQALKEAFLVLRHEAESD